MFGVKNLRGATILLCVTIAGVFGYRAQSRIINGVESIKNSHPFVISLQLKEDRIHICGGSLINPRTVLTGAHCVYYPKYNYKYSPKDIFVALGEHNLYKPERTEIYSDVKQIMLNDVYPNGKSVYDFDMALLILEKEIQYTPEIQRICLYASTDISKLVPTVAGWGTTEDGLSSVSLREIKVPIVDDSHCKTSYGKNYYEKHMICAGYPTVPKNPGDICHGDSGGPLFIKSKIDGAELQIGIVSFNSALFGCAADKYPSAYTKVYAFIHWIFMQTEGDVCLRQ